MILKFTDVGKECVVQEYIRSDLHQCCVCVCCQSKIWPVSIGLASIL